MGPFELMIFSLVYFLNSFPLFDYWSETNRNSRQMFVFLIFKVYSEYYPTETLSWEPKPNTPAWPTETEEWDATPTEYPPIDESLSTSEIAGIVVASIVAAASIAIAVIVWIYGPRLQRDDRMDKKLDQPLV